MKYRKKPVEADAFQYGVDPVPAWFYIALDRKKVTCCGDALQPKSVIKIKTLEGKMKANVGDYIIRGVAGELYPCKADIFRQTYDEVRDDGTTDENNRAGW